MSDTDATNTNSSDREPARNDATIDNLVESLFSLGTVWARYGIGVGRLALKTQAQWLTGVSHLLEQVADALEPATHIGEPKNPSTGATDATTSAKSEERAS